MMEITPELVAQAITTIVAVYITPVFVDAFTERGASPEVKTAVRSVFAHVVAAASIGARWVIDGIPAGVLQGDLVAIGAVLSVYSGLYVAANIAITGAHDSHKKRWWRTIAADWLAPRLPSIKVDVDELAPGDRISRLRTVRAARP